MSSYGFVVMMVQSWYRLAPWLLLALCACSSRSELHAQLRRDGGGGDGGSGGTGAVAGSGGTGAVAGSGGTGAVAGSGGTGAVAGSGGTGAVAGSGGVGGTGGSSCGDGIVNGGEQCDDGAESARCDDDCTRPECGDGNVNERAGEQCDDRGQSQRCNADCTLAECGDGVLNEDANEECDDGGQSARCNADCTLAECGDGIVNSAAGEQCDEGEETSSCNADCTLAVCGDGILNESAGEQCDDGGESESCNADCTESVCGDGTLNKSAGEQCDDGNQSDADGCSRSCLLEGDQPIFSEEFPNGVVQSSSVQCTHWNEFRDRLKGNFAAIELSGSNVEAGVRCEDTSIATRLCNALNEGTSLSLQCGNDTWTVDDCGGTAITVNAPICQCDQADSGAYVVRPCINNENWGGIGSTTCGAAAQRLEVRCLSDGTSVYEQDFPSGTVGVTAQQCVDYTAYTTALTGRYSSVTLSGSYDSTGIACNDASAATQLCNALATRTPLDLYCNGVDWHVDECSVGQDQPFEISANTGGICGCRDNGYTVRPCIGNNNWGGINTATCSAPEQTMRLACNAQPSYYSAQFPASAVSSTGAQCTSWAAFRAELNAGTYTRVTLRGSADPLGVSCSDPAVATEVCQALNAGSTLTGLDCGGNVWNVGECGGVAVSVNAGVCECADGVHAVRPCINNENWGGMGTSTCGGEAQSMDVICE